MKKVLISLLLVALVAGVASAELRAWYKFDETEGTVAYDSSGNGFDATANITPIWDAAGAMGGCMSNDAAWRKLFVAVPTEVFANADQQLTIAWWAQLTDLGGAEASGGWFSGANAGGNVAQAKPYISGDDYYVPYNAGGTDNDWWWGYGSNTTADEWHHFALVFDAVAGTEALYFDGEVVTNPATEATDSMAGMTAFNIFTRTTSATGGEWWDSFHGKMDEFMIYDNALTGTEVMELVPEPMTIALLGLGSIALIRRKK